MKILWDELEDLRPTPIYSLFLRCSIQMCSFYFSQGIQEPSLQVIQDITMLLHCSQRSKYEFDEGGFGSLPQLS